MEDPKNFWDDSPEDAGTNHHCFLCMCGDLVGCKSKSFVFQMNLMLTGFWILVRFGCCETEKRHPESKMYLLKQQLKLLPQW